MDAYVKSEIENGIGTIEFFHPQSNSMPGSQLRNLAKEIKKLGNDDNVKVIILKSGGERAFCAGASFDELISIKDQETGLEFFSGFAHVINAIRLAPKFVIARIHGKVVGGGVGIAAAADYTFATEFAAVKLSELTIGIGPFVVGPAVERKVGISAFMQMTINATEFYTAQWAKEKGLFAEVSTTTDEMDFSINSLANKLSNYNPDAMKHMKHVSWEGTENWDQLLLDRAKISGELVLSEFTKKAINQFKAK
ncbi:enoyl-CoA hydratase/isomerase family protein [Chishuiella sp.]|uniref:enoyl-CoA hydratase/isomerase family protein n=1 Tax=Chishuiella sp. TaxID=1969467 RepID=UPI0028AC4C05|nr:enoyl-CoA hydratase/isomerase family protein [Chishuiella sp.]